MIKVQGLAMTSLRRSKQLAELAKDSRGQLAAKLGNRAVAMAQRRIVKGVAPANSPLTASVKRGQKSLRDRGQLFASLSWQRGNDAGVVSVHYGSRLPYARAVHEGGEITPKRAKMLWVPAGPDTRRFERRYGPRPGQVIAGLKAAGYRCWRQGKAFFAQNDGGGKVMVYILKEKITVPARRFLVPSPTEKKALQQLIRNYLDGV